MSTLVDPFSSAASGRPYGQEPSDDEFYDIINEGGQAKVQFNETEAEPEPEPVATAPVQSDFPEGYGQEPAEWKDMGYEQRYNHLRSHADRKANEARDYKNKYEEREAAFLQSQQFINQMQPYLPAFQQYLLQLHGSPRPYSQEIAPETDEYSPDPRQQQANLAATLEPMLASAIKRYLDQDPRIQLLGRGIEMSNTRTKYGPDYDKIQDVIQDVKDEFPEMSSEQAYKIARKVLAKTQGEAAKTTTSTPLPTSQPAPSTATPILKDEVLRRSARQAEDRSVAPVGKAQKPGLLTLDEAYDAALEEHGVTRRRRL